MPQREKQGAVQLDGSLSLSANNYWKRNDEKCVWRRFFDGQVGEEGFDFGTAHVIRVDKPLLGFLEDDVAFDP